VKPLFEHVNVEAVYSAAINEIVDPLKCSAVNYDENLMWQTKGVHNRFVNANALFAFGEEGTPLQIIMFTDGSWFHNDNAIEGLHEGKGDLLLDMLDLLDRMQQNDSPYDGYRIYDLVRAITYVTKWNGSNHVTGLAEHIRSVR
jgi:hypothetical protein